MRWARRLRPCWHRVCRFGVQCSMAQACKRLAISKCFKPAHVQQHTAAMWDGF